MNMRAGAGSRSTPPPRRGPACTFGMVRRSQMHNAYPPPKRCLFSWLRRAFGFHRKGSGVASQAVLDTVTDKNAIPRSPDGTPLAFGLDGEPITAAAAVELSEDLDRCTMYWTPIDLPDGRQVEVRTVFTVFDEDAQKGPVPESHIPQLYFSAVYPSGPDPKRRPLPLDIPGVERGPLYRLWTYGSLDEAKAGHPEAVEEFISGRARVVG